MLQQKSPVDEWVLWTMFLRGKNLVPIAIPSPIASVIYRKRKSENKKHLEKQRVGVTCLNNCATLQLIQVALNSRSFSVSRHQNLWSGLKIAHRSIAMLETFLQFRTLARYFFDI